MRFYSVTFVAREVISKQPRTVMSVEVDPPTPTAQFIFLDTGGIGRGILTAWFKDEDDGELPYEGVYR